MVIIGTEMVNFYVSKHTYAMKGTGKYGLTLRAYIVYKIIMQNQSTGDIAEHLQELFGYCLQDDHIQRIKEKAAKYYMPTYQQISKRKTAYPLQ